MPCSFILRTFCFFFLGLLLLPSCPAQTPPESDFFSTIAEERFSTYQMTGNGDLWPSCWAEDDNLYAANGDGKGFGKVYTDMAVSRISGAPRKLTGTTIATNVGTNWSGSIYTRKPTGMLCRGGAIYLAFQNLNESTFDDAPAASIAKSVDNGATWTWDASAPMFGTPSNAASPKAYKFTTIFFLDYGQDSANAIDGYVYAYGLDNNWRSQEAMFLGRVPAEKVQTRASWEFYAGTSSDGAPVWTADITQKIPVLTDTRLLYPVMFGPDCPPYQQVIAQGGVTYDAPLQKYIFASWSCSTHELYEASQPWGPWNHFQSTDFGPLRLTHNRGQYGTSLPSKFISTDGQTLWLQSNVCCGGDSYRFSLRRLYLQPAQPSSPSNGPSSDNLALFPGTRAISKSTHFGTLCGRLCSDQLNSGNATVSEDDYDEQVKTSDWWGYIWPQVYNINQVVYTTGTMFPNGGWYQAELAVQVRQNFGWVDVPGVTVTPSYPLSGNAGSFTTYTFNLPNTWGDGVRIIGQPGGTGYFTSINQLAVYFHAEDSPRGLRQQGRSGR
ncbi:MAG: DUF4185 domain-containing protein [Terriglobales bacterium]|jgi:hypothetical protein